MFRSSVSQSPSTQFITHATYRRATYILSHVQHSLSSSPSPAHSLPPPHFSSFPHDSPSSSPSPFLFGSSFSLSPLYFSLFSASLPVSLLIPFTLLFHRTEIHSSVGWTRGTCGTDGTRWTVWKQRGGEKHHYSWTRPTAVWWVYLCSQGKSPM